MALSRSARITLLLVIDVFFFFVELIVGYAVGSLALVADSFHMLNDVISLIVALYAIKMTASSATDSRYSYGWHRAEILAALINGVFLLALCFSIFLEAIERFVSTPEISSPKLVVVVGSFGLASNIIGLFLIHDHAHSHTHSHAKTPTLADDLLPGPLSTEQTPLLQEHHETGHGHGHSRSDGSMNMRALVLHVIGDALGNIGVISTGLVIWLTQWSFKYYFDPVISLVITAIIFSSALPLVRSASFILLQGVPPTISLDSVRDSILKVDGVHSVHELHIWQLSESKVIASVHVRTSRNHDFMPIAVKIREALHHHGIHSGTIQPEYLCPGTEVSRSTSIVACEAECMS
ncbi:Zinc/cadmium resistance protein [Termitomyces sp. J132]|nr:Zinc/cadmium resistance protein [Termitomyces sp. J132]